MLIVAAAANGARSASAEARLPAVPVWGPPVVIAAPTGGDLQPAQLAFSSGGLASVADDITDQDNPLSATSQVMVGGPLGALGARRVVPDAQAVLALGYLGARLHIVTGTSGEGLTCCTTADALTLGANGAVGARRTLLDRLDGPTDVELIPLSGGAGLLAAVASENGVWAARSTRSGGFSATRTLAGESAIPPIVAAAALSGARSIVAWTATVHGAKLPDAAEQIVVAEGAGGSAPGRPRPLVTVPAGATIDSVALAARGNGVTLAWVESHYAPSGTFISQVHVSDLPAGRSPLTLSPASQLAHDVSLTSDARGDQAITWQSCTAAGACVAQAALRPQSEGWSPALTLGELDPTGTPALSQASASGTAGVAWISHGHVAAAVATRGSRHFEPATTVSGTDPAADVALGFSPAGDALAVWTEEGQEESLMGARYQRAVATGAHAPLSPL